MADMVFLTKLKPEPKGTYDASTAYGINSLVMSADGAAAYLSVKDVPAGTPLTNTEYWKIHTDLSLVKKNAEEAAEKALAARNEMIGIARNLTNPVEAEGNPVQAALVGGLPFDKLATVLEPVQAGSGDPYPAGGGRNLIDMAQMTGNNVSVDVEHFDHGIRVYSTTAGTYHRAQIGDITLRAGVNYTLSAEVTAMPGGYARVGFINQQSNAVISSIIFSKAEKKTTTFSVSEDTVAYFGAWCSWNTSIAGDATYTNIQVEIGDVATDYAPYENIRPISGRTGAKLVRTAGNNLWNGNVGFSAKCTLDLCGYTGPITLAVKSSAGTSQFNFKFRYEDGTAFDASIIASAWDNGIWRISDCTVEKPLRTISFYSIDNANAREIAGLAVLFGTHTVTDENYEPPQNAENAAEFSADFGQTVYGGTLDWKTGMLTVDRAMVTLDGTQIAVNRFIGTHGYMIVRYSVAGAAAVAAADVDARLISSTLKAVSADSQYVNMVNTIACNNSQDSLLVCIDGMTTEAEVTAWLAANPVQVVYPLANPTTIQLTPQEIAQLEGINTLYGDGSIAIIGRQKPDLALVSRIEALESAILNA